MLCIGESGYFRYNQNSTDENLSSNGSNSSDHNNINKVNSIETNANSMTDTQVVQTLENNNDIIKSENTINNNSSQEKLLGKTFLFSSAVAVAKIFY